MWGRIDIRIELCEDQHVTILVMYDTGKQIHTVAQDRFNTRSPVDYTIDPSFAVN